MISQERLDEIRARYRVSDVARRLTKLVKAGGEWRGLCPFHKEKSPSFYVNDAKGFYHCFGCGSHGDVIRLAQGGFSLGFPDAVAMIDGNLPPVDPGRLAKEREEDRERDTFKIEAAARFWGDAGSISGTPADLYLSWRGIHIRPDNLRFGRVPSYFDEKRGQWGPVRPALLLRAETLEGAFQGIQRIFLTEDGGKANMPNPKLSLGNIRGASIRFGRVRENAILTGSPEDGLSLYQIHAELETIYVSCGEAMLHLVQLPRAVRSVTIARQNDTPGRAAEKRTAQAHREHGRKLYFLPPKPAFKDWNDQLRGLAIAAAVRSTETRRGSAVGGRAALRRQGIAQPFGSEGND